MVTVVLLRNAIGGTGQKQMFNLLTSSLKYTSLQSTLVKCSPKGSLKTLFLDAVALAISWFGLLVVSRGNRGDKSRIFLIKLKSHPVLHSAPFESTGQHWIFGEPAWEPPGYEMSLWKELFGLHKNAITSRLQYTVYYFKSVSLWV